MLPLNKAKQKLNNEKIVQSPFMMKINNSEMKYSKTYFSTSDKYQENKDNVQVTYDYFSIKKIQGLV